MSHSSINNQKIIKKVSSRRGTLHAFNDIDPRSTALVVIDMTNAFVLKDAHCEAIIPSINSLACDLRKAGGSVAWVTPKSNQVQQNHIAIFGPKTAQELHNITQADDPRSQIHASLTVDTADIISYKFGYSAFFPGKSNLHAQLQERNITTVLICGTVTNVCCESSARDAVELNYQTILIADLSIGHAHGLHEATLNTFYRSFGDVRTYKELSEMLASSDINLSRSR
ncbi:cysteine hydrolase family protein [Aliamphritea ceti]|uniref:cysteine hydrolase family protein n=1 Tax=Aliamphritea ceti TaxID=1524258 RepID=UPI0021C3D2EC|nr:isochorismatase family cysteine hydrolase [Aliamphritea ceti]